MKQSSKCKIAAVFLLAALTAAPAHVGAQQAAGQDQDGSFFVLGSVFLSVLHFPLKLATCLGTQATAAVAYTVTFGVPGNYDGGSNGREIGEVARRSCTGAWVISPNQVRQDYQ